MVVLHLLQLTCHLRRQRAFFPCCDVVHHCPRRGRRHYNHDSCNTGRIFVHSYDLEQHVTSYTATRVLPHHSGTYLWTDVLRRHCRTQWRWRLLDSRAWHCPVFLAVVRHFYSLSWTGKSQKYLASQTFTVPYPDHYEQARLVKEALVTRYPGFRSMSTLIYEGRELIFNRSSGN